MFVGCSQCELIWVNCLAAFVLLCLFRFGCKETLPKGWLFLFWLFVYPQSLQCLMIDWVCAFVFGCDCKGSLTGKFRRFPNSSTILVDCFDELGKLPVLCCFKFIVLRNHLNRIFFSIHEMS